MSDVRVLLLVDSKLQGEVLEEFFVNELQLAIVGHCCDAAEVLVEIGRRDVSVLLDSTESNSTEASCTLWMDQYPDLVVFSVSESHIDIFRHGAKPACVSTDDMNATLSELRRLLAQGHISQEVSNVVDTVAAAKHPFSFAKLEGTNWSET